ncbi:MAG: tripartite motif-containing protein 71, partial [Thermoleophilaceae bacterium]|nr:tripartite motif-containing protein 71 [Thermoleophilaceae bacterium]
MVQARVATLATVIAAAALLAVPAFADFGFLTQWGARGTADGQFANAISGIAVGPGDNVYVEDNGNSRVEKFSSDGAFLTKWGSAGTAQGQFGSLDGIGINPATGQVFVADHQSTPQVEVYSPDGQFVKVFGQFPENIHDLTVDSQGNVIVITGGGPPDSFIKKFDASGNKVGQWGNYGSNKDGEFSSSGRTQLATDAQGNIYITDTVLTRVQKFSPTGQFLAKWGTAGSGDGQFGSNGPNGISVDPQGNVWVADPGNARIQKFSGDGAFLAKFGTQGSGQGQFGSAIDLAADSKGNVFVVDDNNSRIVKVGEKVAPAPTP